MKQPLPDTSKSSTAVTIAIAWLMFVSGMSMCLGPGGMLLGMSIPILLYAVIDRIRVTVYEGKEG